MKQSESNDLRYPRHDYGVGSHCKMLTEYPLSFQSKMVLALLNTSHQGQPINPNKPHKNQTRRVIKPETLLPLVELCPHPKVGDRVWVREAVKVVSFDGRHIQIEYLADGKISSFLPYPERLQGSPLVGRCLPRGGYRETARMLFQVTAIEAERIKQISAEDAIAEGLQFSYQDGELFYRNYSTKQVQWVNDPIASFKTLWNSIYQPLGFGWETNCWVWKRVLRRIY